MQRQERDARYLAAMEEITQTFRRVTEKYLSEEKESEFQTQWLRFQRLENIVASERRLLEDLSLPCRLILEHFTSFLGHADRSISVRFVLNNTGSIGMRDIMLSEAQAGEIRRQDTLAPGELVLDETIYVGEPRDLLFTLALNDEAGNPYTYTANITASHLGELSQNTPPASENVIDELQSLGSSIGSTISRLLSVVLVVLTVLCSLCAVALVALFVLERKQKREREQRRMMREQSERRRQAPPQRPVSAQMPPGAGTPAPRSNAPGGRPPLAPRPPQNHREPPNSRPNPRLGSDAPPARPRENLNHTIVTPKRPRE